MCAQERRNKKICHVCFYHHTRAQVGTRAKARKRARHVRINQIQEAIPPGTGTEEIRETLANPALQQHRVHMHARASTGAAAAGRKLDRQEVALSAGRR